MSKIINENNLFIHLLSFCIFIAMTFFYDIVE